MHKEPQSANLCKTLADILSQREEGLAEWLKGQQASEIISEQLHLDENSKERVYWHFGYLMAIRDVLAQIDHTSTPKH